MAFITVSGDLKQMASMTSGGVWIPSFVLREVVLPALLINLIGWVWILQFYKFYKLRTVSNFWTSIISLLNSSHTNGFTESDAAEKMKIWQYNMFIALD